MAFAFDGRNGVLSVSDETGRKTTIHYFMRYDVAYMGKIRKITDEKGRDLAGYRYDSATVNGQTERFLWDGLALIARGNRTFVNEPAPTGGNPIASGGCAFLNDMLGSTMGIHDGNTKCDIPASLGSVAINYRVWEYQIPVFSGWTTVCVVEGTIEDKYDFHSTANEYFPGLSLEGAVVGWNGGDYVTDNWMKQLNDAGYASEFITTIKWQFSVVLPE